MDVVAQILSEEPGRTEQEEYQISDLPSALQSAPSGDRKHVTLYPGDYASEFTTQSGDGIEIEIPINVSVTILPGAIVEYTDKFRSQKFEAGNVTYEGDVIEATDGSGDPEHPLSPDSSSVVGPGDVASGEPYFRYKAPEFTGHVENISDLNLASDWAFKQDFERSLWFVRSTDQQNVSPEPVPFENVVEFDAGENIDITVSEITGSPDEGPSVLIDHSDIVTNGQYVEELNPGDPETGFFVDNEDTSRVIQNLEIDDGHVTNVDSLEIVESLEAPGDGLEVTSDGSVSTKGNVEIRHNTDGQEVDKTALNVSSPGAPAGDGFVVEEIFTDSEGHVVNATYEPNVTDLSDGFLMNIEHLGPADPGTYEIAHQTIDIQGSPQNSGTTVIQSVRPFVPGSGDETGHIDLVETKDIVGSASINTFVNGNNNIEIELDSNAAFNDVHQGLTAPADDTDDATFLNNIEFDSIGHVTSIGSQAVVESLSAGTDLNVSQATGDVTVSIQSLSQFSTDDLSEGSTNLYFQDERAQDAVGNILGPSFDYDDAGNAITEKTSWAVDSIGSTSSDITFDASEYRVFEFEPTADITVDVTGLSSTRRNSAYLEITNGGAQSLTFSTEGSTGDWNWVDGNAPSLSQGGGSPDPISGAATSATNFLDVEGTEPNGIGPFGARFNDDGTKLFVVGRSPGGPEQIASYDLGTAYDLSTANHNQSVDLSATIGTPAGLAFNDDGTKFYVADDDTFDIHSWTLGSAYDLSSTVTQLNSFSTFSQDQGPQGVAFNASGTKMYITGDDNDSVFSYTLGTPFDISTTTSNNSFDISTQLNTPGDLTFNEDGSRMYVPGQDNQTVFEYELTTPFDINTASIVGSYATGSSDILTSVEFGDSGTKMYLSFLGNFTGVFSFAVNGSVNGGGDAQDIVEVWQSGSQTYAEIAGLNGKTTSDLPEGSNLYFTEQRAQDATGGSTVGGTDIDTTYDGGTGTLTVDHASTGGATDSVSSLPTVLRSITVDGRGHVETLDTGTFTGGTDIDISGSTIEHADTGAADFSGTNGEVVNDIQTDGRGHVDTIGSTDLDGRYYTETEADSRFVNVSGDTMSGALNMDGNNISAVGNLDLNSGTPVNEIKETIADPGVDTALATEAAIRSAVGSAASAGVTSVSGGTDITVPSSTGAVTVNHASTGGASDNNTNDTFVENITFDGRGHVESIVSSAVDSTTSSTLLLDSGGTDPVLLNVVTGELQLRNQANTEYRDLRVRNLVVEGTETVFDTQTVSVTDNTITLNSDATGTPTEDASVVVERGSATDARITWIESGDYWAVGLAGSEQQIVTQDQLGTNIIGGTDIDTSFSGGSVTINHANTGAADSVNSGATVIQTAESDDRGHLTNLATTDVVGSMSGGTDITVSSATGDPVTINHANTGAADSTNTLPTVIRSVSTDARGHVETLATGTFIGGTDIDISGDTINHANTGAADSSNSGSTVLQSLTTDGRGHVETISTTDVTTTLDNQYVLESGDTVTGQLNVEGRLVQGGGPTGIETFAGIMSSEGAGDGQSAILSSVQDQTKAGFHTRNQGIGHGYEFTSQDFGTFSRFLFRSRDTASFHDIIQSEMDTSSGDITTNIHDNLGAGATRGFGTVTFGSDVDINDALQVDSLNFAGGTSVNSITTSLGDPGDDSTLATEAAIRSAVSGAASSGVTDLTGGTDITVSSSTGSVTVNHANTGAASSTGNSGGTVIQTVDSDGRGHLTSVGTTDLDTRYYTQSSADSTFVDESGDTMTGTLTISGSNNLSFDTGGALISGVSGFNIELENNGIEINNSGGTPRLSIGDQAGNDGLDLVSNQITRVGSLDFGGTSVNSITTSLGDPGDDGTLATEAAIRSAVDGAASSGVTDLSGGTDITVSSSTGSVTVNHANTGGAQSTGNSGVTAIQNLNTDGRGHVTSVSTTETYQRWRLGADQDEVFVDDDTTVNIVSAIGGALQTNLLSLTAPFDVEISHSVVADQSTGNSGNTVIQNVGTDGSGHVTSVNTTNISTFSGDHADLSNVQSDQHHTRYTDGEAQTAVTASDVGLGRVFNTQMNVVDTPPASGAGQDGDVWFVV